MRKQLHRFIFAMALTVAFPTFALAAAPESPAIVDLQADNDITININGQTVTVCGAQGETLEIVSLTGRRMMTVKIESPAQRIELNVPKGCYILKVGKVVRKVSVR